MRGSLFCFGLSVVTWSQHLRDIDCVFFYAGPISVMLLHGKVLVTAAGTDLARWAFNDAEMKYHKQPQVVNTGDVILCGALLENFLFLGNRAGDLLVRTARPQLLPTCCRCSLRRASSREMTPKPFPRRFCRSTTCRSPSSSRSSALPRPTGEP